MDDHPPWQGLAEHHRTVLDRLVARGTPREDAEDIAQDTWIHLIERHRAGQLPRVTLPGLAVAQARFLAAEARRTQARRGLGVDPGQLSAPDPSAEDRATTRQQLASVEAELARCGPRAARVFDLVCIAEQPHASVARDVGLSVQRVRQTVCEIRSRLRSWR